jgi:hypothetical protein
MSRALRAVVLFATALVGLVGGHLLGYLFAIPDAGARDALLARTGHSYLSKALIVASAAAIVAGATASVLGAARARQPGRGPLSYRNVALHLVALQLVGFLLLEVAERLLAGAPGADLLSPVLIVGLPLQAVVAAVGALVLVLVARTAAAVVRALAAVTFPAEAPPAAPTLPIEQPLPRTPLASPRITRGPPLVRTT